MEPSAHVGRDGSNGISRDLSCAFFINDWALASQSPIVDRAIPILERIVDRETSILDH